MCRTFTNRTFWDQLDRQVRRRTQQPETLDQLRIALEDEWQRIHMASINRLISLQSQYLVKEPLLSITA
jgi:hypothetical protein